MNGSDDVSPGKSDTAWRRKFRMHASTREFFAAPGRARHPLFTMRPRTDERHERRVEWHAQAPNAANTSDMLFSGLS
jgi:hypothetical protein